MKQNYIKKNLFIIALIFSGFLYSQTNRVKIEVNWPATANQNKVEVYDPADNLLLTICNTNEDTSCYSGTGSDVFDATYDLGCLATDPVTLPNYYVKLFDLNDDGWSSGSTLTIKIDGIADQTIDVSGASSAGSPNEIFNVSGGTVCTFPDSDGDGVIDLVDIDDDNDGILDIDEGLAVNQFNCEVPSLIFFGGAYEGGGSGAGTLNAIYRFDNAIEGYDVLLEIVELDNTSIVEIDDDADIPGESTPNFLQSKLNFTGTGTPGITYKFTIVDAGTSTPASTIFRIGGTTWDCDGTEEYQESVRYYNPSAYGLDNPTSLTQDIYVDGAGITAGTTTYDGFSTNTILRSYFQFLSNTFTIRMQLKKTTTTDRVRYYAMSFTQCDIFEYKAPTLTILSGEDSDGDGVDNQFDFDADNDGIPDNVELQATTGYVAPNNVYDPVTGVDTAYTTPIDVVDTDEDDIPDFLDSDSDNDGTPDIEENGMANVTLGTDTDSDGLDDAFEGVLTNDPTDVNDEIDNPSSSILPDTDNDLALGGDLDYRDAIDEYLESATVDFDGIDDYIDSDQILSGLQNATIMAWVKLDNAFTNNGFIVGQDNFNLRIQSSTTTLIGEVNGSAYALPVSTAFDLDKWVHVAAVYEASNPTEKLKIYVNGEQEGSLNASPLNGGLAASTENFTIGRNPNISQYFKGAIDEVRVFDVALTEDQLQQMIFQEIEDNATLLKGTVIPKNIEDFTTNTSVSWTNLQAYYPMSEITTGRTLDFSDYGRTAILHNITTLQPQTAPMPYETKSDGIWETTATWLNGSVWDIQSSIDVKPWAIFNIKNNVSNSSGIQSYGLIVDDSKTLTLNGDNQVSNGWYLELNGTIDLQNDSQLIQSEKSDLVTGSDGKIIRRQEGNLNFYWYNYWSSPVGSTGVTNNMNTDYTIDMIRNSDGVTPFTFTSAYDGNNQISNRWLYKYQNGITYFDWEALTPSTPIEPGTGFTQKGIQNAGGVQQYSFVGKPNNGTILLNAIDNGGPGSVQDVSLTNYLVGNPYPSALDARQFINDNAGVIYGTLYVWEQWAGISHNLNTYEGGYATINNTSTERAYLWSNLAQQDGVKTPTFYIPVGQGFFTEVIANGDIEFNNGQRVFVKESDADGDPNNGSVFFRNTDSSTESETNLMGLIRIEFTVSNGNSRRFVLGFSDNTTDDFDYGYDGRTIDAQEDDLNSLMNDQKMIIQALSPIENDKVVDLVLNTSGTFNYTIEMIEISNIPEEQEIYLRDNFTNTLFDLRSGAYNFTSEVNAEDTERFDIVFQPGDTLSNEDYISDNTVIFVNNTEEVLYVKGLEMQAKLLSISNMLGQDIRTYINIEHQTLESGLDISDLSSGVYIVRVINENNQAIDKKVIVD